MRRGQRTQGLRAPSYDEFVDKHGGKSTRHLSEAWGRRFNSGQMTKVERTPGGAGPRPGNEGVSRLEYDLPAALQPPVGGGGPGIPPEAGPAQSQPPAEVTEAIGSYVSGRGGNAPESAPIATEAPGAPVTTAAAESGQQMAQQERNPELDLLLRKYKAGAG
jgi:hypothetical protein